VLDEHGSDPHEQGHAAVGLGSEPLENELQEGQHVDLLQALDSGNDDLLLADVQNALKQVPVLGVNGLCVH
jgi:hypothetical protein